jgi:hypothetical protein
VVEIVLSVGLGHESLAVARECPRLIFNLMALMHLSPVLSILLAEMTCRDMLALLCRRALRCLRWTSAAAMHSGLRRGVVCCMPVSVTSADLTRCIVTVSCAVWPRPLLGLEETYRCRALGGAC